MLKYVKLCFILIYVLLFCLPIQAVYAQTGITWAASGGPYGGKINVIMVHPSDPSMLYAGTPNGLYQSQIAVNLGPQQGKTN